MQERFLFVVPPSKLGHRQLIGQPVPSSLITRYRADVTALLDVPLKPDSRESASRRRCHCPQAPHLPGLAGGMDRAET